MKDPADRFQTGEELVETLDASRLSGPEIPLAIRMLHQELGSMSMAAIFSAIIVFMMASSEGGLAGDMSLLLVIIISVVITRITQTMREVGRLAASGFSAGEIGAGLRAVMAERDQRRSELAGDPAVRRARRQTIISAVGQLVLAFAFMWLVFRFYRHPRPDGRGFHTEWPGGLFVLGAMIMFGVGLALLLRSPFRASLGERLYRMLWTGPIGRAFVRFSGRRAWRKQETSGVRTSMAPPSRPTPAAVPPPVVAPGRIEALEQRVSELERWRKEAR